MGAPVLAAMRGHRVSGVNVARVLDLAKAELLWGRYRRGLFFCHGWFPDAGKGDLSAPRQRQMAFARRPDVWFSCRLPPPSRGGLRDRSRGYCCLGKTQPLTCDCNGDRNGSVRHRFGLV